MKEMGVLLGADMGDAKIWFQKEAGVENSDGFETRGFSTADSSAGGQRAIFPRPMAGQGLAPLFA